MFKEFRDFALKGNVIDLAVGIVIGAAFTSFVTSLVADIIMPPIGLILGKVDFTNLFIVLKDGKVPGPYPALGAAKAAGAVSLNVGLFLNAIIGFVIVAYSVFLLVKGFNRFKREEQAVAAPAVRECPYYISSIPVKATRCPQCTSELKEG